METRIYCESCDASAAIRLGTTTLFVIASDEDNVLRVFNRDRAGVPITRYDVTSFLEPDDPEHSEADIEGAARIDKRIYWIGSHGRSRKGELREVRQRFFATTVEWDEYRATLEVVGVPYRHLLEDLFNAESLRPFNLEEAATRAPEAPGGLNIEGLATTPAGELLIGFRNPIPDGRALLVRMRNPAAVVEGRERAVLDLAGHLDLGGRGIRAMEYVLPTRSYVILAGASDDKKDFAVYGWNGTPDAVPTHLYVEDFDIINPEECVFVGRGPRDVLIDFLSDDGTKRCKHIAVERRTFRGTTYGVNLPGPKPVW
ncbi:MAG: DUF3616 domain-containing protein [Vicinamibacterales bacterium]